jgi:hypothetical protein
VWELSRSLSVKATYYLLISIWMFAFFMTTGNLIVAPANSHFFGSTKNVNGYRIVFSPYPSVPIAGDNSTLINLSLLDSENQNINNIFASLVIKEKNTGNIVKVFPFKFYEFSDISIPYTFQKMGDYLVTVEIKINGDPTYGDSPLRANFDISASNPNQVIPFDELIVYYVIPASAVMSALAVYLKKRKKI